MAEFDDLDGLDDLGDLQEISFDDTNPVVPAPAPAAAPAAPTGGLGAVIYDLISKRNYQQVIQIAESQKSAVEQDPQVKALVDNARAQLQKEATFKSYLDGARQAMAAGQTEQAQAYFAKAREIDPQHPELAAFAASASATAAPAPAPAAPAPAPAAPAPAAPAPALDPLDEPLSFDDSMDSLPDLSFDSAPAPAPAAPAPAPAPAAPAAAAPTPAPAAPAADPFAGSDFGDFGDLSLDAGDLPAGFEPAGMEAPAPMPDPAVAEGPPGGDRIPALIQEGQAQFDQGQYQAAIDTWSRIFLIDIDHAEASRLIEEARNKKAELERQAEEMFHTAADQIEQQQLEEAKATLAQVLQLQPSHSTARDYLDQLEAGQVPVISRAADTGEIDLLDDGGLGAFDGVGAVGGQDAGQTMEAAVARDRVVVVKKTDRRLLGLATLVAVLLVGGGGFLAMKWDDLFPNTSNPAPGPPQIDQITRATKILEAGKIENAILLLEKVGTDDPSFTEAQALIAQWRSQLQEDAPEQDTGPTPAMVQRRNLLLKAGRDAHADQQFIRARKYLERANKILPLEAEDVALRRDADHQLEKLQGLINRFNDGQYKEIIPELWKRLDDEPDNKDAELLLVDSYYSLALSDLQRQNPGDAADKLAEILNITPNNREIQRLKQFAETYENKSTDLLYSIFVKYLPSRS